MWLARDSGVTKREVAIKVVRSEGDVRFLEALASEARTIARIPHHPNMVVLYDVLESSEDLALVMEYVPGRSLTDLIEANPRGFSWNLVQVTARGLLEGVAHAHRHSVIHRDLKPDNIRLLVTGQPLDSRDVKILDWGLARSAKQASVKYTKGAAGSFMYMSPEQFEQGPQGPFTDVYALGLLIFEMVTGRSPFGGEGKDSSFGSIYRGHCHEEAPPVMSLRPGAGEALSRVLARALAKQGSDRYLDAGAFLQELLPVLAELATGGSMPVLTQGMAEPSGAGGTRVEGGAGGTVLEAPLERTPSGTLIEPRIGTQLEPAFQRNRFQQPIAGKQDAPVVAHVDSWVYLFVLWQLFFGFIFGLSSFMDFWNRMGLTVTYFGSELTFIYRILAYTLPVAQVGCAWLIWKGKRDGFKWARMILAIWPSMILLGLLGGFASDSGARDVRTILAFNIYVSLALSLVGYLLLGRPEAAKGIASLPADGLKEHVAGIIGSFLRKSPAYAMLAALSVAIVVRILFTPSVLNAREETQRGLYSPNVPPMPRQSGSPVHPAAGPAEPPAYPVFELVHDLNGHSPAKPNQTYGATRFVNAVKFSPDGNTVAACDWGGTVWIWDVASGQLRRTIAGTFNGSFLAFSPNGQTLFTSAKDRKVAAWDIAAGNLLRSFEAGGNCVAVRPDGNLLATTNGGNIINLYDPASGKLVHQFDAHDGIASMTFAPAEYGRPARAVMDHSEVLVTGTTAGTVTIWDPRTGNLLNTLTGQSGPVVSVEVQTRGGSDLVSVASDTTRLWRAVENKVVLGSILNARGGNCAFLGEGNIVGQGQDNGQVKFWNINTGNDLRTLQAHTQKINAVAVSQNEQWLATVSNDETVKIWHMK